MSPGAYLNLIRSDYAGSQFRAYLICSNTIEVTQSDWRNEGVLLKFSKNIQTEHVFFARVVLPMKLKPRFIKKEGPGSRGYLKMVYSASLHSFHSFSHGANDFETGDAFTIFKNTPFGCSYYWVGLGMLVSEFTLSIWRVNDIPNERLTLTNRISAFP